jgi:hypothetical protein
LDAVSATIVQLATMFILVVLFLYFKVYETDYFQFGPSPSLSIFGIVLDTWTKLILALIFASVLQTSVSTTSGIIGAWQVNDINNQYIGETRYSLYWSIFIAVIHYLFDILDWFISMKMDLYNVQFLISTSIPDFTNYVLLIPFFGRKKRLLRQRKLLESSLNYQ